MPDAQVQAKLQQATTLYQAGQLAEAQALYEAILAIHPTHFDALHLSGVIAAQTRDYSKAIERLDKAIAINPLAEAYSNRGNVLKELKEWEAALASYNKAIALKPGYAEAYYNRGNALKEFKQWEAAIASYDQAIALKPDHALAYSNRGVVLKELRQWDAALTSYDHAIAINPRYGDAYSNRGNVLQELRQWDAAIASYDRAIALKPDFVEAWCNRGNALKELKQWEAAIASYDRAIAVKPGNGEGHFHKSLVLLLSGDFENGWKEYEWRWKADTFTSPRKIFSQPLWLGKESLAGKTILLHCEQGLGDSLQFCRYARLVSDLGAKVILQAQTPLASLLADVDGVTQLVAEGEPLPAFDYHCPLLSLPLALGTNLHSIPASGKYLASTMAKKEKWHARLGVKTKPRIGLVWSGNPYHKNDRNRSIPLSDLIRQLPASLQYVSLQKEVTDADKQTLESHPEILHPGNALEDFSDTAGLCELMDVIISVDTSTAHLSGALGRPTWILLPFVPDWRWLLDRKDTPWYPAARLFRQSRMGDWADVIAEVTAALESFDFQKNRA